MRIIYTKNFPPADFHGLNLLGTVFVQSRWGRMSRIELNHERIHTRQQFELLILPFFILYGLEYLIRLPLCRFNADRAYRSISFEREAYANERNISYLRHRRPHTWLRYILPFK
jgi:hypothetical protein